MNRKDFATKLRRAYRRRHRHLNPLPEEADADLEEAEQQLNFPLPPIVKAIYKYGGVDFIDLSWSVEQYLAWYSSEPKTPEAAWWPEKRLPLADEGCSIWSCLDCSHDRAPVLLYRGDYGSETPEADKWEHLTPSFAEYLRGQLSREDGGYADDDFG